MASGTTGGVGIDSITFQLKLVAASLHQTFLRLYCPLRKSREAGADGNWLLLALLPPAGVFLVALFFSLVAKGAAIAVIVVGVLYVILALYVSFMGPTAQNAEATLAAIRNRKQQLQSAIGAPQSNPTPKGEITRFESPDGEVKGVAFSPDGCFAAAVTLHGIFRLWNLQTGRAHSDFKAEASFTSVLFSPNGQYILTASIHENQAQFWEIQSGREVRKFIGHDSVVKCIAMSADGRTALTGSWDTTVRLWNVDSGQAIRVFRGHQGFVYSVALSENGRFALSGGGSWNPKEQRSVDNVVRLWDVATGKELRQFLGHTKCVNCVAFLPGDGFVLSGGSDRTLRLWELSTGAEVRRFEVGTSVSRLAVSPDGRTALSASDKDLMLWDLSTGQVLRRFSGHTTGINSIAISFDGRFALSGAGREDDDGNRADCTVRLWELSS